jgi:hypothetical protein
MVGQDRHRAHRQFSRRRVAAAVRDGAVFPLTALTMKSGST